MSMEANAIATLGRPAEIAETAVREFRKRKNLLSRSWLAAFSTFVLLPLPLLAAAWFTSMTVTSCSLELLYSTLQWSGVLPERPDETTDLDDSEFVRTWLCEASQTELIAVHVALLAVLSIPAAGVAALYGRLARRTPRQWLWGLTACTLVGLGFGAAKYDLTISDRPGKSQLMFMVGLGHQPLQQCCYSLMPLAVGVLVLRRSGATAHREAAW